MHKHKAVGRPMRRAELGLVWCAWFYRDAFFYGALLAGVAFWAIMWCAVPTSRLAAPQVFSLTFFMLVVGQPALEELLFRGYVQGYCQQQPWGHQAWHGLTAANGLTALLFTAAHLWSHPPLWALAVLAPALVFGHCRDRYGSLYPGLCVHAFYNAGYFGLMGLPVG